MATTSRLALPYPVDLDDVDVAGDIQALADRLDLITTPKYVTSLPGSPADMDEIFYAADATNGVIWHLRYRSGAGGSYKWEFVGGAALYTRDDTTRTTASGTPTDLTNLSITAPLAGDYQLRTEGRFLNDTAGSNNFVQFYHGSTAGSSTLYNEPILGYWTSYAYSGTVTAAAAESLHTRHYVSGGNSSWLARGLSVLPVRVG